jgi:DNA-directed RNA polymerase subunit RPC12/RpoP
MTKLKFWDIDALLDVIRAKPHILETDYESRIWDDYTEYGCSECYFVTEDFGEFRPEDAQDSYKCPECWADLFTEDEIEDLVEVKRKSYTK